ncbi:MAG: MerR family transcriptional regulator [Gracilibacteraceae bacterium]|jgi:DNA-binding transcriptional MerR regulator|nr:MerR family transcriptional regulator [Gracilibacteraceae bacterium]
MEYTVNKLAKLAGVSTRTLRYYDQCGLLAPCRVSSGGYRIYGRAEVDRLQQILFYRELGFGLDEIKRSLSAPGFEPIAALSSHLDALRTRRRQLDTLIQNVENSIRAMKGDAEMSDTEKFEGFKQKLLDGNEEKYGAEIRAKYGDAVVDASNAQVKGLTARQYADVERLSQEIGDTLKAAMESGGDPAGALAQKVCALHKNWLCYFWTSYSPEAHKRIAGLYVDDPRFTAYYDKIAPGCAVFLRDAINIHAEKLTAGRPGVED